MNADPVISIRLSTQPCGRGGRCLHHEQRALIRPLLSAYGCILLDHTMRAHVTEMKVAREDHAHALPCKGCECGLRSTNQACLRRGFWWEKGMVSDHDPEQVAR